MSQPHSTEGNPRIVYVVAALSALGGLLFGYDTGVISVAIPFIRQDFALSDFTVGLVVSALLIGAVIEAAIGGDVSDHFGRRKVIITRAKGNTDEAKKLARVIEAQTGPCGLIPERCGIRRTFPNANWLTGTRRVQPCP